MQHCSFEHTFNENGQHYNQLLRDIYYLKQMHFKVLIMCVSAESGSAVCEFFMRAACVKGKNNTQLCTVVSYI